MTATTVMKKPSRMEPDIRDEPTKQGPVSDEAMQLIFEKSTPGATAVDMPALDVPESALPDDLLSSGPPALAEVGQLDLIRHYTHLAAKNFSIDRNFYPLGSCTMKYNPRINEAAAAKPGFAGLHPLQDDADVQGALRVLYELRTWLAQIAGLDEVCLQPCAGAHGEYTALKVIRAYFQDPQAGNAPQRRKVLAPDTAHGTNPASCAMCGAGVVPVPSKDGMVDLDALRELVNDETAALMITNPNTAGLFDGTITEIAKILHDAGALLYLDGANMNAIVGVSRPGDFGVDVMHFNTHKTFSTPHGCGGPGAGPIAVRDFLAPYLPVPQVMMGDSEVQGHDGSKRQRFYLDSDRPKSIGKVRSFTSQFGVLLRCWVYIAACGPEGLRDVAQTAVLNANYLAARLHERFNTPYFDPANKRYCAHEFIIVPKKLLAKGVSLTDIAKRLIDYGIHPPTMHWPVHDCLMIEPTETEGLAVLDHFVDTMNKIADEIDADPSRVKSAPQNAPIRRLDEVAAAVTPYWYSTKASRQLPPRKGLVMAENTFWSEDHPGPSAGDPREEHRYSNLEDRVNRLTLICWSMWTLIMETTDLTEEDLLVRMKDLDVMDGQADNMVTPQIATCPKCNRTMSAKHNRCLYCGAEKTISGAFDYCCDGYAQLGIDPYITTSCEAAIIRRNRMGK